MLLQSRGEGRGDFTSRKNIPGKLPTFLLALVPKVTVPSRVRAVSSVAVITIHTGALAGVQGGGGARGWGVSRVINIPFTFAHIQSLKPWLLQSHFLCGPCIIML